MAVFKNEYDMKLVQIVPYKNENDIWTFILYYERKNLETGEVVSLKFENVENPFPISTVTTECWSNSFARLQLRTSEVSIYGTTDEHGKYVYCTQVVIKEGKEPAKEMTVEQIEKELGYPVKIVKEKGKK